MSGWFLKLESLISGMFPFAFLMVLGIYLTLKTKAFQFRNLGLSVKAFFAPQSENSGGLSTFQSACNSLAATVGTGNIVGVASAVALGGAGAVFWMWVSSLVAMCIKAGEIVLAINYKENVGGEYIGGPMYYIKNGLSLNYYPLAVIYAFTGIFSCFASGNIIQTNSAVFSFGGDVKFRVGLGVVFAIVTAVVIVGGVSKISSFTTKAVPFMSVLYIVLCFGVIFSNMENLSKCFYDIFKGAFNPSAVSGGVLGSFLNTVISGASKGVFSNEAGLGTAAMAYAACGEKDRKNQALYGVFEVFLDTVILCTLTALTILCSGVIIDYGSNQNMLVSNAFSTLYGNGSKWILAVMLSLFGISSIIGWAVYGITCSRFLFGNRGKKIFVFIYPLFCIVGAVLEVKTVWRIAEFFNGIMLTINLFALAMLKDEIILCLKETKSNVRKNRKS